jgi:hypothetical protein
LGVFNHLINSDKKITKLIYFFGLLREPFGLPRFLGAGAGVDAFDIKPLAILPNLSARIFLAVLPFAKIALPV